MLREHGGMSRPSTAKLVQDSVNGRRKVACTTRAGPCGSKKGNGKGRRIDLGAVVHFVRVRLWLPLLQKVGTIVGGHQVGGGRWVDVCRDCWEACTAMATVSWKHDFVSGHEQRASLQHHLTVGPRHLGLGWCKTLWTHVWIDHMFAYLCRWDTLAWFNSFVFKGSHV